MPDCVALAKTLLKDGYSVRFRAEGHSMRPSIRDGDILTLLPTDPQALQVGDIVLCERPDGSSAIHRIAKKKHTSTGYFLKIQGDAQIRHFDWIPLEHAIGRVLAIQRNGKVVSPPTLIEHIASWSKMRLMRLAIRLKTPKSR